MTAFNFPLKNKGDVSQLFLEAGVTDFETALQYIKNLPYQRNSVKDDLSIVFKEQRGTCSTKHALVCKLAREHNRHEVELVMGIFKMNGRNTPVLTPWLEQHRLDGIPEAHNYLRINGHTVDVTMPGKALDFEDDLLDEIPMEPEEIGDVKVSVHRVYLQQWIKNEAIPYTLDEIWNIREQCIALLSV